MRRSDAAEGVVVGRAVIFPIESPGQHEDGGQQQEGHQPIDPPRSMVSSRYKKIAIRFCL